MSGQHEIAEDEEMTTQATTDQERQEDPPCRMGRWHEMPHSQEQQNGEGGGEDRAAVGIQKLG
jgi:hypothetical protein